MKKTLTILSICGFTAAAFAQGTIAWNGSPGSGFVGETNSSTYSPFETSSGSPGGAGPALAGNATGGFPIFYELLTSSGLSSAPTSLSQFSGTLSTAWLDTGLEATNNPSANARITFIGANNADPASNWAVGATQNAIMVGWSANLGATWATALANLNNWAVFSQTLVGTAWFGLSASVAVGADPGGSSPGITIVGSNPGQINGAAAGGSPAILQPLGVSSTPEPTTVALAGLGGLALLGLRRKK